MPPRSKPEATEEHVLAEAVYRLSDRLLNLQNAIDDAVVEITHEVRKLIDQAKDTPLMLRSLPIDPCDPQFARKVNQAPDLPAEPQDASSKAPRFKKSPRSSLFPTSDEQ